MFAKKISEFEETVNCVTYCEPLKTLSNRLPPSGHVAPARSICTGLPHRMRQTDDNTFFIATPNMYFQVFLTRISGLLEGAKKTYLHVLATSDL
jgi:hypothetical protein